MHPSQSSQSSGIVFSLFYMWFSGKSIDEDKTDPNGRVAGEGRARGVRVACE
jgi:hypothetical protein